MNFKFYLVDLQEIFNLISEEGMNFKELLPMFFLFWSEYISVNKSY